MRKYIILLALACAGIIFFSGTVSAQTVIPSCADSNLTVSNDAGARFNTSGNGNNSYNFFNSSSQSATQGQNALHITTSNTNTVGNVTFTTDQMGTFYFSDTGGRGWDDNGILMLAINGTIPDNFWIHITASGYQWTPLFYTEHPDIANIKYVSGAVNETFTKDDFLYGPQIWKPSPMYNNPIFAGQNMEETGNTFNIIFIDLWAGILGPNTSYYNSLIDHGMIKIDYEIYNLPEGSLAAFNAYAYCQTSKQGEGVRWGNRVTDSGYHVTGVNVSPVADFSAKPTKGTVPMKVEFTDKSTGTKPFTYAWDFNNDGIVDSIAQNPSYTYTVPGTYTVKLTVTNTAGSSEKTMIITTSDGDIVAPSPSADLPSGSYNTNKTINLTATDDWDSNPKIYYTLDGFDPTTSSTLYTGPINIGDEGTTTLKFIAVDSAGNPSDPVTVVYIIDKTAPTAGVDLAGGIYHTSKTVKLTATDANGTKIYYTIDGSDPKSSNTRILYTGSITIGETTTVRYAAVDTANNWSTLYNVTYTMIDVGSPIASADLPSGSYITDKVVKLTATDELDMHPKIYYTLNGTTPTTNSTLYNWPITINFVGTTVLKFIAVDAAGHISNVYTKTYILNKPGSSGTWNTTIRDINSEYTSIAVDASGYPHIAYYQKAESEEDYPELKYTYKDQNGWHTITLETSKSGSGYYVSLVLDSLGYPHLAYSQSTPDKLKYAFESATGWHIFDLVNNTDVSNINLVLYNDQARISYFENTEERLMYMYFNGTNWTKEYVTPGSTYGHYNSLALNSNGNPRISYYEFDNSNEIGTLMYAKRTPTGTWQIATVDNSADVGMWNSIAVDSLGNPRISYNVIDGALKYAYWNETRWIIETVDPLKSIASKLILDPSGNPRIVYQDFISGNFKYAYREGSKWIINNIDTIDGVRKSISITMNPSGIPNVSYISSNSRLKYAYLLPFTLNVTPKGGTYQSVQKVTLTSSSGTTIYYTTDGSDPRLSSSKIKYSGSIQVNSTKTIKFAALDAASNWSSVYTQTYVIIPYLAVTSIDPVNNAVNVSVKKVIKVAFNRSIMAGNNWIELKNTKTGLMVPITTSIGTKVLTITPKITLANGVSYLVILHSGCVKDLDGRPAASSLKKFTTVPPLAVSSVDPVNNAVNVSVKKVIKVTFNQAIMAGNNWIELKNTKTGLMVPITTSIGTKVMTITPKRTLSNKTSYLIILHSGSVRDLAGKPVVTYVSKFTTI